MFYHKYAKRQENPGLTIRFLNEKTTIQKYPIKGYFCIVVRSRGISYNSRLAVARLGRSPPLAAAQACAASLRSSILAISQSIGLFSREKYKNTPHGVFLYLCAREESNLDYKIRNLMSYPLNDERMFSF
jgi:hypothetical protein